MVILTRNGGLSRGGAIFTILILLSAIRWAVGGNLILFGTVSISPAGNRTSDLAFARLTSFGTGPQRLRYAQTE
ncbi:hypothetical protein CVV38_00495 [Candidatus Peregrinibacteria bacterium HGW-Peregrinibacteria-1]|nr:MAG: hypothetical protein CVV38_00495 [Candidatus Peregrinibacteria bacterium HGW-Peregrinibacteria-1]